MTRADLLQFLVRCVRDSILTERQAAELLQAFDEGTLDPADLPTQQEDSDLAPVILSATAALVAIIRRLGYPVSEIRLIIPDVVQTGLKEALRADFTARSRAIALQLERTGNVAAWQRSMGNLIKRNVVENAIAGAGRALTPSEIAALRPMIQEQMAFLGRFADKIALGKVTGKPMSTGAIAARAETYGRMGLAVESFFKEASGDFGFGWVAEYIAVDDGGTCGPCHAAQGDYLSGEGPHPGELCFGGMRCRCHREMRYDPASYTRLTGEVAA